MLVLNLGYGNRGMVCWTLTPAVGLLQNNGIASEWVARIIIIIIIIKLWRSVNLIKLFLCGQPARRCCAGIGCVAESSVPVHSKIVFIRGFGEFSRNATVKFRAYPFYIIYIKFFDSLPFDKLICDIARMTVPFEQYLFAASSSVGRAGINRRLSIKTQDYCSET